MTKPTVVVTKVTDVELMRKACAFTINKDSKMSLKNIYKCEHSPMRTQMFTVEMYNIPTFVSVHFVRHKIWCEHFVKTNRDDRESYTGDNGRWQPVNHMMFCNSQALITMAQSRLCLKSHIETVKIMELIKSSVKLVDPDLYEYMVPKCLYRNGCYELKTCGYYNKFMRIMGM